jgi:hypothetical protein
MKPTQTKKTLPTAEPLIPERFAYIFKNRPVLWFEDDATYDALLGDFIAEYTPQSLIEHLDVKDATEAQWEAMRLHRINKAAIDAEMPAVIVRELGKKADVLRQELDMDMEELKHYALVATRQSGFERTAVDDAIRMTVTSHDALLYRTFVSTLMTSGAILERIARAERRRDGIIKKYEERRRTLTAMKRSLIDGKQAADVTEVSTTELKPGRQPAT